MGGAADLRRWQPTRRDVLVAVGVCTADTAISTAGFTDLGGDGLAAVLAATVVAGAIVASCRRAPLAALGAALAHFALVTLVLGDYRPMLPTLVCLYAVSAGRRRRVSLSVASGTFVLTAAITVVDELSRPLAPAETQLGVAVGLVGAIALFDVLAWGVGRWVRASRRHAATQAGLAELRRREAVADERAEIARNMHDTVSGAVTGVLLHAAGARQMLLAAGPSGDTGATVVALENIETAAQKAMAELRDMLDVLRAPVDARRWLSPDDVVDALRGTGLRVRQRCSGEPRPLPAAVADAARHVLQESLTNCARHAGAGAEATVAVVYEPTCLVVEVRDDGRGTPQPRGDAPTGGSGLAGTRTRVESVGGYFSAGPVRGGGYIVEARLPASATPA